MRNRHLLCGTGICCAEQAFAVRNRQLLHAAYIMAVAARLTEAVAVWLVASACNNHLQEGCIALLLPNLPGAVNDAAVGSF